MTTDRPRAGWPHTPEIPQPLGVRALGSAPRSRLGVFPREVALILAELLS